MDLSNNDIRDISPNIIASLKTNTNIINLDFHNNRLEGKVEEGLEQILKNFQKIISFASFLCVEFKINQLAIKLPSEFKVSKLKYFDNKTFDELRSGKYNSNNEVRIVTDNGKKLPNLSELINFAQEKLFNLVGVCKGPLTIQMLVFGKNLGLIYDEVIIPNFIVAHISSFLGEGMKCLTCVKIETRQEIEEREAKDFHNFLFGDNESILDWNYNSPPMFNEDIVLVGESDL